MWGFLFFYLDLNFVNFYKYSVKSIEQCFDEFGNQLLT